MRGIVLLSLALTGCASRQIKLPCEVDAHIVLDSQGKINSYCWPRVSKLDNGQPVKITTMFKGCTDSDAGEVHSMVDNETIGHEIRQREENRQTMLKMREAQLWLKQKRENRRQEAGL